MENSYLIVGLGNPGEKYADTRHNAGFLLVERLAKTWRASWRVEKKFEARLARLQQEEKRILLAQPQTFMNSSGESVFALLTYYRVPQANLMVIVDDADLPFGHLRLRPSGSSGGHNGLKSIEQHLGSREYARLRIGIGRRNAEREITDHVLGRFNSTEAALMDKVLVAGSSQVETWLRDGLQKAMNQYNGAVEGAENESKDK